MDPPFRAAFALTTIGSGVTKVAPLTGATTLTEGTVPTVALTVITGESAVLPRVSVAFANNVMAPGGGVSQMKLKGALRKTTTSFPFTYSSTPATVPPSS